VVWRYDLKGCISSFIWYCVREDVVVAAHMELSSGSNKWNVSFTRVAHD
jgi:hypothetical protein